MTDPVVKTITVPCAPDKAFSIFTADFSTWWPKDKHSVSAMGGETARSVALEPHVGGKITEVKADGETVMWGSVSDWQPGKRLVLDWHIGLPAEQATSVEVAFEASDSGTLVTLTHSGWEVMGESAVAMREGYNAGWVNVFEVQFKAACQSLAA